MPDWGFILQEINESELAPAPPDLVRRKYLMDLHRYTNRDVILHASNWTQPTPFTGLAYINEEDVQGLMVAVRGLKSGTLDLILHSPGGVPEVTESMVSYLRKKFDHIRVIVPQAAMSAATMLACAADEIVMGKQSSLGPIDPQLVLLNRYGDAQILPVQAVIDNFETAKKTSATSPRQMGAFLPILEQYTPGLIEQCHEAQKLSTELASKWLKRYMFKDDKDAGIKANDIANRLADHSTFKSHARHINVDEATKLGLKVTPLEDDQRLQDLVLSTFHATTIVFQHGVLKIIENHLGKAFIKHQPPMQPPPIPPPLDIDQE